MQSLRLTHEQIQAMVDHARNEQAHEACGIIAGGVGVATRIIPIQNTANNPQHHYQMNAKELLLALKNMDAAGEEMIGIYHSHPGSEAIPSLEDIQAAQVNTPNTVHVIIGLKYGKARLQAWHIHDGLVEKVELLVGNQSSMALLPMTRTQIMAVIIATILAVLLLLTVSLSLLPSAPPILTLQ
jgi:proteasome lid subunit RPN8/RPN11